MTCDLRFGRWQDVLQDVTCDALIVDAPYSERTHSGHDTGADAATRASRGAAYSSGVKRAVINYSPWTAGDVADFVDAWAPRTKGWIVSITDHTLFPAWVASFEKHGRYAFAPLPFVNRASGCRYSGDGPSNWTCWIAVCRPRSMPYAKWATLPGAYECPPGHNDRASPQQYNGIAGGKPLWLMRALVRDYSRPGDLVCDPCAGGGTTLIAAGMEGRRAVGAECLPDHFEIARKRLARGFTPSLFAERAGSVAATQAELDLEGGEP